MVVLYLYLPRSAASTTGTMFVDVPVKPVRELRRHVCIRLARRTTMALYRLCKTAAAVSSTRTFDGKNKTSDFA
jgi:hypothetical protein